MKKKALILLLIISFQAATIGLPHVITYCSCKNYNCKDECTNTCNDSDCNELELNTNKGKEIFTSIDCCKTELEFNNINDSFLSEKTDSQNNPFAITAVINLDYESANGQRVSDNKFIISTQSFCSGIKIYLDNSVFLI
jgi:hypothetical protein